MANNDSSTRGTSPAFMLYAADLLTNRSFRMMSFAERGLLMSLLCECWVNVEVPADRDDLSAWLGKDVADTLTDRVLGFFKLSGKNLVSADLEDYRERVVERRKRMVEGGHKGGKRRAEKDASHPSSHPSREDSSHPSSHPDVFGQATLKGREPEPEPESEPKPESPSHEIEPQGVVSGGAA